MRKCGCGLRDLGDKKENYQGWYNYNVWNVMLWAQNDERIERKLADTCRKKSRGELTKPQYERAINHVALLQSLFQTLRKKSYPRRKYLQSALD